MSDTKLLKNLIIDLGGVIVDLDVSRTTEALSGMTGRKPAQNLTLLENELFHSFEKGELTASEFRTRLRNLLKTGASDVELDAAWNAMIVDIPLNRIDWLVGLRDRGYRLFLLSNTNEIHYDHFTSMLEAVTGHSTFGRWFDQCYYSYRLGMRKPELAIYRHILTEHELRPEQTMMIDDNPLNLEGAASVGLQIFHAQSDEEILSFR